MDDAKRCTAKTSASGYKKRCGKARAHGTKVCATHGAGSPQSREAGKRKRQQAKAAKAVQTYGLPAELDPHDALLEEVHRTAGHVRWLADIVADLDRGALIWGTTKSGVERGELVDLQEAAPNIWLTLYQQERSHLVKVAKAAIDAGIDERRVQLAEQQGALIVSVIRATLTDLGVQVTPEVASTVGRHLRSIEGGKAS